MDCDVVCDLKGHGTCTVGLGGPGQCHLSANCANTAVLWPCSGTRLTQLLRILQLLQILTVSVCDAAIAIAFLSVCPSVILVDHVETVQKYEYTVLSSDNAGFVAKIRGHEFKSSPQTRD